MSQSIFQVICSALSGAGKYPDGLALAQRVAQEAQAVHHPPFQARVHLVLGLLQGQSGKYKEAEASFEQAVALSAEAREASRHADAWIHLRMGAHAGGAVLDTVLQRLPGARFTAATRRSAGTCCGRTGCGWRPSAPTAATDRVSGRRPWWNRWRSGRGPARGR